MPRTGVVWNALVRTHHITNRKKVSKLKQAAGDNGVFVLLRSGGSPGIMYVEGPQEGVETWVSRAQVIDFVSAAAGNSCLHLERGCATRIFISRHDQVL